MRANTLAVTLLRRRKIREKKETKKRNVYTYIYSRLNRKSISLRHIAIGTRFAPTKAGNASRIACHSATKLRQMPISREKKFAAMQNRDSPSQNRAASPDVQKLADCALHLARSIPFSRERERERGMAIEFARVNSAQKRKPGTLATPNIGSVF